MPLPDIPDGRRIAAARKARAPARPLMVLPFLVAVQTGVAERPEIGQHYRPGLQVFR